jgi:hypothetical protein
MNKELLLKQMEEYKNEAKITGENKDKMIQMLNQQEVKMQQLIGAIAAIERLLKEDEDVRNENKDGV